MLSVHMSQPLTVAVAPSARSAVKAASTDAAPPMSIFMSRCIGSDGFRLMPPESYMMPLPTSPRCPLDAPAGVYRSFTMRGSSALPAFTPSRPPQPRSMSCCRSNTSTSKPKRAPSATATSPMSVAVRWPGGVFARSRAMFAARAVTTPVSTPADAAVRSTPSSSSSTRSRGVSFGFRCSSLKR